MTRTSTKESSKTKIELCSCSNNFSLNLSKTLEQLEVVLGHNQRLDRGAILIMEISACLIAQVVLLDRIEVARVHKRVVVWSILRREERQLLGDNHLKEASLNSEGDN